MSNRKKTKIDRLNKMANSDKKAPQRNFQRREIKWRREHPNAK